MSLLPAAGSSLTACGGTPEYSLSAVVPLLTEEIGSVVETQVIDLGYDVESVTHDASCQHFRTTCVTIHARRARSAGLREYDVLLVAIRPGTSREYGWDVEIVARSEEEGPEGKLRPVAPSEAVRAAAARLVERLHSLRR